MNPLSSIPPLPARADPSSPPKESVLLSQDSVKGAPSSSSLPSMDVVSLSLSTQEGSHYLEVMAQIPDVRQSRIAPIQRAIDSNSYVVSPEDLADKLLQELHIQSKETRPPTDS